MGSQGKKSGKGGKGGKQETTSPQDSSAAAGTPG